MPFEEKLKSTDSQVIKKALNEILDAVAQEDPRVLQCDKEFYETKDKHAFLAKFESNAADVPSEKPPELLEKWMHYCWIRAELSYLANQKASLNVIYQIQSQTLQSFNEKNEISALVQSVSSAIQEDALNGVPIAHSIQVLRQMVLQIVGTEHPTDPLSQSARDLITQLANAINADGPSENTIKQLLHHLQKADSIPPFRRDVPDEVNRNIRITLDKLYDSLPYLVNAILNAYRVYYGEVLFLEHENEILTALEGGLQPNGQVTKPIVRDASWAGFDADGNENMNPEVMRYAIRLHRIRSAEKQSEVLNNTVIRISKEIERRLRIEIVKTTNHNTALQAVVDKQFQKVLDLFEDQQRYLLQIPNAYKDKINKLVALAKQLLQLTAFSGVCRDEKSSKDGALQELDNIFKKYKEAIRENTDAIEIIDSDEVSHNATEYVIQRYDEILKKHQHLLAIFPELKMPMRHFGIQLRCYGMTYGVAHIRQDSSIYSMVWETLLEDLKADEEFTQKDALSLLQNRKYSELNHQEKLTLQKTLQDKKYDILNFIYKKNYARKYYVLSLTKKEYSWVCSELERIELALRHHDMFENIIISNSECAANIFEVESLLRVFPTYHRDLVIVPLLEKRKDLESYESILTELIKIRIQDHLQITFQQNDDIAADLRCIFNLSSIKEISDSIELFDRVTFKKFLASNPDLKTYLKSIVIEVMCGFSDTERVSGLAALISVQQVQEDIFLLTKDFGVQFKLYHGPGGDTNRGGLRRRDEKATLQGNARSCVLNTLEATQRYRETQFYNIYRLKANPETLLEFTKLPAHIREWINMCKEDGAKLYEQLHDTENGMGKLLGFMLGQGAHWLVTMLNSSSRATQRGIAENHGDRTASVQTQGIRPESYIHPDKPRAISATQIKEVLRDYIGLLIGPGYGMRKLGLEKSQRIFESSETIRDMFFKMLIGLTLADFSFLEHALFADYPHLVPRDREERKIWANECFNNFDSMLPKKLNLVTFANENKDTVMYALSRLFAYIIEEVELTKVFAFEFMHSVYFFEYRQKQAPVSSKATIDLLYPFPVWKKQTEDSIQELMPLSYLLARQNNFVARGVYLDKLYMGLNNIKHAHSKLTGVGRLLGNVGAGITAGRIMPPGYYESVHLDYKENLRLGVMRAESERNGREIDRNRLFALKSKVEFEEVIGPVFQRFIQN